jgi:hypothetical protein
LINKNSEDDVNKIKDEINKKNIKRIVIKNNKYVIVDDDANPEDQYKTENTESN